MPTVFGYHDVKDTDHWLASPKREEFFGPIVTAYVYPDAEWQDTLELVDAGAQAHQRVVRAHGLEVDQPVDPVGPAEGLFGKRFYLDCIKALKPNGMLVQQSESPLLHLELIKEMHQAMREAGFAQTHLLHFPQPIYPSGWWSGSIACKQAGALAQRLDEKAIAALDARYYNADTHRGAFALPTYMRKALGG